MIRKEELEYAFRPDLKHGEELLFYAEFAGGVEYSYTTETVLFYRKHGQSAMSDLDGLLDGYVQIGLALKTLNSVGSSDLKGYKLAARRIMFRSFLKSAQPFKAISAWARLSP